MNKRTISHALLFLILGALIGYTTGHFVASKKPISQKLPTTQGSVQDIQGFIRGVQKNDNVISLFVDQAEFLSGDIAITKAMEDTKCPRNKVEECVPSLENGFYIRNKDLRVEPYTLDPRATLTTFVSPGAPDLHPVTADTFISEYNKEGSIMSIQPFTISVKGNTITSLEEQYTP